jgi:hypothetical protein
MTALNQALSPEVLRGSVVLASPSSSQHLADVRGSPLIRSLFLALALVVTAGILVRVTTTPDRTAASTPVPAPVNPAVNSVPFHLTLSSLAAEVEIDTGKIIRPPVTDSVISGTLEIDPENPRIALRIRWRTPTATHEHRFAKLTLEPPAQATITRVFDAAGDIDDFLELPLSFAK